MTCCDPDIDARLLRPANVKFIVAVVLVDSDGRVLISQRPEGKPMAGLWEFPGGKMEANETPEAALVREIREELGIKTCAGCLLPVALASHSYEHFHLVMPVYVCRQWEGTPTAQEGQVLKWVRLKELKNYPMPEADVPLVTRLQEVL